jgi:predicted RNA-binding Zn-ribbon protein involved in translation (DUF1610 family)
MDEDPGKRFEAAGEQSDPTRLDGNAAAGILSEIFVSDLTVARATCANCGTNRALGALMVYAHGMGTIMRCPNCDAAVLRVARTRAHLQLDLSGARLVVVPSAPAPFAT